METKENKTVPQKTCIFSGESCIHERCDQYMVLQQSMLGVARTVGMCSLPAIAMIMSSRPPAPPQQQQINLPNLKG